MLSNNITEHYSINTTTLMKQNKKIALPVKISHIGYFEVIG